MDKCVLYIAECIVVEKRYLGRLFDELNGLLLVLFWFVETESNCVFPNGLELTAVLPCPPEFWGCRTALPFLDKSVFVD